MKKPEPPPIPPTLLYGADCKECGRFYTVAFWHYLVRGHRVDGTSEPEIIRKGGYNPPAPPRESPPPPPRALKE